MMFEAFGFTRERTPHCRNLSQLPSGSCPLPLILVLLFFHRNSVLSFTDSPRYSPGRVRDHRESLPLDSRSIHTSPPYCMMFEAFGFTQERTLHCRKLSQLPSGLCPLPLILVFLFSFSCPMFSFADSCFFQAVVLGYCKSLHCECLPPSFYFLLSPPATI
ncbi:hypothetical protein DFH08DRAFT_500053 [Mycena albidolilacea]|uniref:Uncharacterized protein n=1 Tax=Mycena albidolilacea TaxID=1033008 RepID=A0AAD7AD00_9AGAR|nr:hypothetical protein DFH08DRAFT_500053 [Mycena albidolilacea]